MHIHDLFSSQYFGGYFGMKCTLIFEKIAVTSLYTSLFIEYANKIVVSPLNAYELY